MSGPSPRRLAVPADLAVVVVNYNAGKHLDKCLSSVLGSAGDASIEVVVVDNASADGSARRGAAAHPEIRLIENGRNRGFAAAVNQGIDDTTAPFVLLINPDAQVVSGTLAALLKVARDHPRAGALGPLVREPDGEVYPSARRVPSLGEAFGHVVLEPFRADNRFTRGYTMAGWDHSTERTVDWVSGSCMLLRREALDEVGHLDPGYFMYAEDVDLCTRLSDAGWTVLYTPELEVVHEGGVSSGRSRRMILEHSKSAYRYFRKHRARGWRLILLPFAWALLRLRAAVVSRRRGAW